MPDNLIMNSSARASLFVLLLGFILLLAGCIQPAQADRCKSFTNSPDHDGCLRYFAVWDQEPYLCYSIPNATLRESCLEAATDPIESQKLKDAQANGVTPSQPVVVPGGNTSANDSDSPAPTPTGPVSARMAQCLATPTGTTDSCARQVAIDTLNMTLCGTINAGDFRASCISNVALTVKNPTICVTLNRTADQQICTYYSSG
jgi:hypothetical protein